MKKRVFAVILALYTAFLPLLSAGYEGVVFSVSETNGKKVALTFDDGPHPYRTDEILDVLSLYNVKATFFVVGQNAEYYPNAVLREVREGHEIGNHTYSHVNLKCLSQETVAEEVSHCSSVLEKLTGRTPTLFRPPEGACCRFVTAAARSADCTVILWDVDTRDWALEKSDTIIKNIKKNVRPGSIVLFHDYTVKGSHTVEALKEIIPYLIECGYSFVTVSQLMEQ